MLNNDSINIFLVASTVLTRAKGQANGVFVDGTHELHLADCGIKTCGEDGRSCCEFSSQDEEEFTEVRVGRVTVTYTCKVRRLRYCSARDWCQQWGTFTASFTV